MKKLILSVLLTFGVIGVSYRSMAQNKLSYLALGDSYTIGEAVKEADSWPMVLSKKLSSGDLVVSCDKIIATTGWTTDELLAAVRKEEDILLKNNYNLVSLLIGVNNQYRDYSFRQYKKEFKKLVKKAINFAGDNSQHVFVLSIPDYGVTPFAEEKDKDIAKIASDLMNYNNFAKSLCIKYNVAFYDITPISLKAQLDNTYVAADGLHPSAKMYKEWAAYIAAGVLRQIK